MSFSVIEFFPPVVQNFLPLGSFIWNVHSLRGSSVSAFSWMKRSSSVPSLSGLKYSGSVLTLALGGVLHEMNAGESVSMTFPFS